MMNYDDILYRIRRDNILFWRRLPLVKRIEFRKQIIQQAERKIADMVERNEISLRPWTADFAYPKRPPPPTPAW